jgi:hypothetical protein
MSCDINRSLNTLRITSPRSFGTVKEASAFSPFNITDQHFKLTPTTSPLSSLSSISTLSEAESTLSLNLINNQQQLQQQQHHSTIQFYDPSNFTANCYNQNFLKVNSLVKHHSEKKRRSEHDIIYDPVNYNSNKRLNSLDNNLLKHGGDCFHCHLLNKHHIIKNRYGAALKCTNCKNIEFNESS